MRNADYAERIPHSAFRIPEGDFQLLRFDGLYVGPPKTSGGSSEPNWDYLRFYEDGWVINCVSLGTPEQVIRWFYRDNPAQTFLLKGPFDLQGDHISFSPEFRDIDEGVETVTKTDYEGQVVDDGNALELKVGSPERGPGHIETYRFVELRSSNE
jgi:hypothetical protein